MMCNQCGGWVREPGQFCSMCGVRAAAPPAGSVTPIYNLDDSASGRRRVPGSFSQNFGLDPRIAVIMFILDAMLNAGEVASMGLLAPVSLVAGVVLGYVTYKAQMHWYGDDKESARIKAIIVGLLTAIPTPLPEILYLPFGMLGFVHNLRAKKLSVYRPPA